MRHFDRNKLINLRKSRGYSLGVLVRLLKARTGKSLSRAAVSNWERGVSTPGLSSVLALSELFEVPVDYFFEPKTNYLLDALAAMSLYKGSSRGMTDEGFDRSALKALAPEPLERTGGPSPGMPGRPGEDG